MNAETDQILLVIGTKKGNEKKNHIEWITKLQRTQKQEQVPVTFVYGQVFSWNKLKVLVSLPSPHPSGPPLSFTALYEKKKQELL